jgi:cardiolipin synthase
MEIKELFKDKVFTFSNLLTSLRIIMVPFIGYMLFLETKFGLKMYRYYALIFLCVIILTDFLDGFIARVFNQYSRLGQFLDPIADKIATNSVGFLLYYYRELPLWVILVCFLRDIYGFLGATLLYRHRNIQAHPNLPGKIVVVLMGVAGIIYILDPQLYFFEIKIHTWSIGAIFFFILYSAALYWKKYSKVYFEQAS